MGKQLTDTKYANNLIASYAKIKDFYNNFVTEMNKANPAYANTYDFSVIENKLFSGSDVIESISNKLNKNEAISPDEYDSLIANYVKVTTGFHKLKTIFDKTSVAHDKELTQDGKLEKLETEFNRLSENFCNSFDVMIDDIKEVPVGEVLKTISTNNADYSDTVSSEYLIVLQAINEMKYQVDRYNSDENFAKNPNVIAMNKAFAFLNSESINNYLSMLSKNNLQPIFYKHLQSDIIQISGHVMDFRNAFDNFVKEDNFVNDISYQTYIDNLDQKLESFDDKLLILLDSLTLTKEPAKVNEQVAEEPKVVIENVEEKKPEPVVNDDTIIKNEEKIVPDEKIITEKKNNEVNNLINDNLDDLDDLKISDDDLDDLKISDDKEININDNQSKIIDDSKKENVAISNSNYLFNYNNFEDSYDFEGPMSIRQGDKITPVHSVKNDAEGQLFIDPDVKKDESNVLDACVELLDSTRSFWHDSKEFDKLVLSVKAAKSILYSNTADHDKMYVSSLWAVKNAVVDYYRHKAVDGVNKNAEPKIAAVEQVARFVNTRLEDMGKSMPCPFNDKTGQFNISSNYFTNFGSDDNRKDFAKNISTDITMSAGMDVSKINLSEFPYDRRNVIAAYHKIHNTAKVLKLTEHESVASQFRGKEMNMKNPEGEKLDINKEKSQNNDMEPLNINF